MGIPQVDSCCFCVPLRTGTLVLGYLHLIGSIIGIVIAAFMVIGGAVVSSGAIDLKDENLHLSDSDRNALTEENLKVVGAITIAIGIILLILFIVQFVFVIFLLIGGHKGKPGHIKAYLVYSVVMVVIALILTVLTLFTAPSPAVISHLISYAIEIYFLVVIRSYMIKLQENPEGDRAGKVYKS